jgi:hypothetical protein
VIIMSSYNFSFLQTNYAMARALNILPTSYSYGDSMIMARAVEAGKVKKAMCSSVGV